MERSEERKGIEEKERKRCRGKKAERRGGEGGCGSLEILIVFAHRYSSLVNSIASTGF